MIDTDVYNGHTEGPWHFCLPYNAETDTYEGDSPLIGGGDRVNGPVILSQYQFAKNIYARRADMVLIEDAPKLLAEVKRLSGLLDEIDDVIYYHDKKAGQVLPVEKPNLELLRDIMMSYADEACQIRGDEGGWIE